MQRGWDAPLFVCIAVELLKDGKGKKNVLKYFFTARKIIQNVDLCPQSSTKSNFAISDILTSQSVWDSSSQLQRDLTLDSPEASDVTLKAPQGHGEGAVLPQHMGQTWMFDTLQPNSVGVFVLTEPSTSQGTHHHPS